MLVAGRVFETLSNIYVLSLYYANTTTSSQQLMQNNTNASRHLAYVANELPILTFYVGHFRVCFVLQSEESLDKSMVCFKSFDALSSLLRGTNADPMDFLPAAQEF